MLRYRFQILIFLLFLETGITILSLYDTTEHEDILNFTETTIIVSTLLFTFFFSNKFNYLERLNFKRELVNSLSETKYIYYDKLRDEVNLSAGTFELLKLPNKKLYSLTDIENLLYEQWSSIAEIFEENFPKMRSYSGVLQLSVEQRVINFRVEYVHRSNEGLNGVVIFFRDVTEDQSRFQQVIKLMNQYRQMSFTSEVLFNSLPIPIWCKSNNGEMLFFNAALENLCNEFGKNEIFDTLGEMGTNDSNLKKMYIKNSLRNSIRFHQLTSIDEQSHIGYAINLNEHEEVEKRVKNLALTLEKVMELSVNAIVIVNAQGRVNNFNHGFANLFELDFDWLNSRPYYSQVLDKMREKGKLPEMRDYKEFKDKQLKLLSEIVPSFDYWYLLSEQTIKYAVIPIDARSTLFMFNDVSEELKSERMHNTLVTSIREVMELYPYPTIIFGPEGRVKLCNSAAYEYFDIATSEIIDALDFKYITGRAAVSDKCKKELVALISKALNTPINEVVKIKANHKAIVKSLIDYGVIITFY